MAGIGYEIAACPFAASERLQQALGISRVTADVLVRRGLDEPVAAERFLDATAEAHDPRLLGDLDDALELLATALDERRRIVVHGDYDADGICATAVLVAVLRALGGDAEPFLPSRFDEGYGLAVETVERLHAEGAQLLVTVDCGITAVEAAARAAELGLPLVITDHHRPADALPDCPIVAVRGRGRYPEELSGTGVAWKLAEALVLRRGAPREYVDRELDLVALATVADVIPLLGESRALVAAGMRRLRSGERIGIDALCRVAQSDRHHLDTTAIGFRLAPRINAAGRLGSPRVALDLMLTTDRAVARDLATRLDAANRERQTVEQTILQQAVASYEALPDERKAARGVVLASAEWHPGVIGIVASRLVERLGRPVVLIALDGEEGRGSGRSLPAFDLHGGLAACADHLIGFGGHRAAAGLTIAADRVEAFASAFAAHADGTITDEDLEPTTRVDAIASVGDLSLDLADELARLEPCGMGNPSPRILIPAVTLRDIQGFGDAGRHGRAQVTSTAGRCAAVWWSGGAKLAQLDPAPPYDVIARVERNDWNGASSVRLSILKVLPSAPERRTDGLCATPCDRLCPDRALPRETTARVPVVLPAAGTPALVRAVRSGAPVAELLRLVATGEPVVAVCADVSRRRPLLETVIDAGRYGIDHAVLVSGRCRSAGRSARIAAAAGRPALVLVDFDGLAVEELDAAHVAVLDPPSSAWQQALVERAADGRTLHVLYGGGEAEFAAWVHAHRSPRAICISVWRALGTDGATADELDAQLGAHPLPADDVDWALGVLVAAGHVSETAGRFMRTEDGERCSLEGVEAYRARQLDHDAPAKPALVVAGKERSVA